MRRLSILVALFVLVQLIAVYSSPLQGQSGVSTGEIDQKSEDTGSAQQPEGDKSTKTDDQDEIELQELANGDFEKRGLPMSGSLYGKRGIPFNGGLYGKRAVPMSGGLYGKRGIPFNGGLYG